MYISVPTGIQWVLNQSTQCGGLAQVDPVPKHLQILH